MHNGKPYTITENNCSSHGAVWSDNNGGECTVDVTPQFCEASGGTWYNENGGGCKVDPSSELVLGSFAQLSKRSSTGADINVGGKGHGDLAMTNMILGCFLGLAVAMFLLKLVMAIGTCMKKRSENQASRVVPAAADVEGGYKDVKVVSGGL
jgi:hypothetical protein